MINQIRAIKAGRLNFYDYNPRMDATAERLDDLRQRLAMLRYIMKQGDHNA